MAAGVIEHEVLGSVTVNVRQHSRHVSARWKNGVVSVNVPQGIRVTELRRILDNLTPRLMATRPEVRYHDGQEIECGHLRFVIKGQNFAPDKILGTAGVPVSAVEVGSNRDWDFDSTSQAVSDMLCKIARKVAPEVLISRAKELSRLIGRQPVGWTVSSGHRTLGHCSGDGIIALSYVLVFLPTELSDYVIYHELAHLSEMNHSDRFHMLLDGYLGGRERELRHALNTFRWPVLRK